MNGRTMLVDWSTGQSLTSSNMAHFWVFEMVRKTKVRIVGEPNLSAHIALILAEFYELEKPPERYQRAVGRDYAHSQEPGVTIYMTVKGLKNRSIIDTFDRVLEGARTIDLRKAT